MVPICPKCGDPVAPGAGRGGMVWGFQYDVDANGEWVTGSERGAFFHQDCWDEVKEHLPDGLRDSPLPDQPSESDA